MSKGNAKGKKPQRTTRIRGPSEEDPDIEIVNAERVLIRRPRPSEASRPVAGQSGIMKMLLAVWYFVKQGVT